MNLHPMAFEFADFELDVSRFELRRDGAALKLEKLPMELLILLVSARGGLVSREHIVAKLWGPNVIVDFEHGINTAIRKIRLALDDDREQPRYIETVVGKGYRFTCPVVAKTPQAETAGAAPIDSGRQPRALHPSAPLALFGPRSRPLWLLGVVTLFILATVLAIAPHGWEDRMLGRAAAPRIESVGVLPLANLSGDPAQDYFADGMTDELIVALARLGTFRVISRTSMMQYKRTEKPLPKIARELGVDALVEGSVSRSGEQLRVRAQLIHAAADQHLWADTFERSVGDVLTLQSDLADAIARRIEARLAPEGRASHVRAGSLIPAALDAYLKGRLAWHRRTEAGLQEAIDYFRQAIALDPGYAAAYSGMADSYTALGYFSYIAATEAFSAAREAALKALELDPTLAEPHASLGYVHLYYDWDRTAAEREFKEAIALNPNYSAAHHWYGVFLTALGRHDEAAVAIARARELDPLSPAISTDIGFHLYYSRRYDEAMRHLDAVVAAKPGLPLAYLWRGRVYQDQLRYADALANYRRTEDLMREWPVTKAAIGHVLGTMGDHVAAESALQDLHDLSKRRYVTAYGIALVYAALGDNDAAFEWLNRSIEERTHWLVWLKLDPRWDNLRSDPRFEAVQRRVGFPE
jgi:TolB-like protein/DNA-binding winged helix-turn-helix (wHTH) protein/Tfp pilus assembly protein PilF